VASGAHRRPRDTLAGVKEQGAPRSNNVDAKVVAPYFLFVSLVHLAAVATRFDGFADDIPPAAGPILMIAQFPLLFLSGYFEGRLDYGENVVDLPLWMRINSKPVKLAFTLAFMYLTCVVLQRWDVEIGPIDPTPPAEWPEQKRLMWFGIFTLGMFFPFYLAATGLLIPALRFLTKPLRALPTLGGIVLSLIVGLGIGILVFSALSSVKVTEFVKGIKQVFEDNPAIGIAITFGSMIIPPGLVAFFVNLTKKRRR
jgi:hypothetical protein